MKKNPVLYMSLVVGIIVLFIGIGIQPAFATIQPEKINVEYYDVKTEFIGLDKNYTKQLTKEQIQELDALFNSFWISLNKSISYEDTVEIYKEMILQLDSYGLLGDCSVKQIQELVTGHFQKTKFNNFLYRLYGRIPVDDNSNTFCLISGSVSGSFFLPLDAMIVDFLIYFLDIFNQDLLYVFFEFLWMYMTIRALFVLPIRPSLLSGITLGGGNAVHGYHYTPANGWIHTQSRLYERNWEGSFYGKIAEYLVLLTVLFIGVIGFKGIKIDTRDARPYYLGSATYVKIGYEPY